MVHLIPFFALVLAGAIAAENDKSSSKAFGGGAVGGGAFGGAASGFSSSSSSASVSHHSKSGFVAGGGGGFNFGGLGLPMAFSPFGGLINQIGACRSSLVSGISAQVAFSQVSRIASMFQQAIGSLQGCGTCGLVGPGLSAFGGVIQRITGGIISLVGRLQGIFPSMWQGILTSAFQPLGGSLPGLFNFCNGVGLPVNKFFGGGFSQCLAPLKIGSLNQSLSRFGLL
ncbi:expressed protein [Phakopsora pachyrhizi]|uniref:Expressed protein n=1 Tax=Phakopsora pachyrhizi TaxID=170000 RepID=A0A0S1MK63_PHAPC|nr:expressed protein [Phakopsora pachyrhizi]